jgi:hypothetical protein
LVHCHAGCPTEAVVAALGLTMSDLGASERESGARGGLAADPAPSPSSPLRYDYRDESGALLLQVVRFRDKKFRQRRPKPGGGWEWSVQGVRQVPYRLPELVASDPSKTVYVVEGEKDAEALARLGLTATCNAGGAGKWTAAHAEHLRDRPVAVLPDNDKAGKKHARQIARSLWGVAARTRVVRLPGLPEKGDASDWLAAGGSKDALAALVEAAADWEPQPPSPPHQPPTTNYSPLPVELLPSPAREFVESGSAALGCDPAYVALPLLAALAAAVGNTRQVCLKGSWREPCVVWAVIIGESGTLKSPALDLALEPLRRRQAAAYRDYVEAQREYEQAEQLYEADSAAWRKKGRGRGEPPPSKPEPPRWRQWVAEDTTVEALAVLLEDQPRGLLVARDELSGWFNSFDAYKASRGTDVAHWLAMHRAGPMTVNRKVGRPLIRVPRAAVSVCGGVQPLTLAAALGGRRAGDAAETRSKPSGEHFANGLAARLLLAMPPRLPKRWTEADLPDARREPLLRRFDELFALEAATDAQGEWLPVDLPLTQGAKRRFVEFYNAHAEEQCALAGDLAAAWAKAEGYAARLALLHQLVADPSSAAVDEAAMEAGIGLARWFADEAARVYGDLGGRGDNAQARAARETARLTAWIRARGGAATPRDLMRGPRKFRGDAQAAEAALDRLVKAGRGRWEDHLTDDQRGRPTRVFQLATRNGGDGDENAKNAEETGFSSPPAALSPADAGRVRVAL